MWKKNKKQGMHQFQQFYPLIIFFILNYFPSYTQYLWKTYKHTIFQVDYFYTIMWKNKNKVSFINQLCVNKYVDFKKVLGNNQKISTFD